MKKKGKTPLGEWIVAKFDHFVGPNKRIHAIVKGNSYRIIAKSGNLICVKRGSQGFFGWTLNEKF